MGTSLHQIELEILQLLGIVIGSGVLWLLKRALAWFNIRLTAERQAALSAAVDKMMTLGVTKADGVIRDRGWDHIDSKNAVINAALPLLETRFSETLANVGLDPNNEADKTRLVDIMERMWPDIAARLSASPATPPAPTTAIAVAIPAPPVGV